MRKRLLIVEDEPQMREIVTDYFTAKDFEVTQAADGERAIKALKEESFDMVLLDIMMPGLDGFAVCRQIRRDQSVPVIFLTALGEEQDKLHGYELGADDYMTKPFSLPVLHAKCLSLMKRAQGGAMAQQKLEKGGIALCLSTHTAYTDSGALKLTKREFELLFCLMRNAGCILTREQLLDEVWGIDYDGSDRVVDTYIKKLRGLLGNRAACIQTAVGVGYRFEENAP